MIIYNVTIKVENDIVEDWINWMQGEHINDLIATGLFVRCRLCRLLEQDETDGVTFSAQYECDNLEKYNTYISDYAPIMREKGFKRFGGRFIAFRSVMEVL
jgi:hypothetical protein